METVYNFYKLPEDIRWLISKQIHKNKMTEIINEISGHNCKYCNEIVSTKEYNAYKYAFSRSQKRKFRNFNSYCKCILHAGCLRVLDREGTMIPQACYKCKKQQNIGYISQLVFLIIVYDA